MSARAVVDRVVVASRTCTSSACRANTCCAVMTRCARPPPRKTTVQLNRTESRFLKPVSDVRRTTSQSTQAGKPETCSRPTTAIARRREMVAIEPDIAVTEWLARRVAREAASDGERGMLAGLDRDLCHAGQIIQAHEVTNHEHLGVSAKRAVGLDGLTRPVRSSSTLALSATMRPSGEA